MPTRSNRRHFLKSTAALGTLALLPASSWARVAGAAGKLRVASVGCGGKGWSDLVNTAASPNVDVVALCDIDESKDHFGRASEKFPQAKRYTDWRRLLDDAASFDAVIVSTPDHMHAPISLAAMQLKKHVQCQKPLTHTVHEARQMQLAAKKYDVVTQMGNQIQSHSAYRTAVAAVHAGAIGKVREVHSWQGGSPTWRLVDDRPAGSEPVPTTIHWDEWLGVAPERPYLPKIYHAFNWRNWLDFSNGQLGDFGCHILDPVFMALKLTAPTSIRADAPPMNKEVWPKSETVVYEFPGTDITAGKSVRVTWYDGAKVVPPRETLGLPESVKLGGAGSVLVGEKGSMLIPHVAMPTHYIDGKPAEKELPVVEARDHYVSWADACRGEDKTTSHFDYASPLTETVLLGTIAARLPGSVLKWDSAAMKLTGAAEAQAMLTKPYRKGWEPTWI
ncbi:1,5-anhydro-D-fructose reductase [Caulifigura coniformis]|uniref:1,5-anhydro-D-fructose reductase n=1 Tax=Caulifigura coniformis TaxID=2527983 RepID=A0A517SJ95_9PLAN|nr:Gfo/Idh/MocA family oxidoreductase [Caulifigura coniformis]QDT56176.1 1,5-anhydro-D-fructose reductase [Caulifigura coniformis]